MIYIFSVPPQSFRITSNPSTLQEGRKTEVYCKVGKVKPVGDLEIQLLKGTSQINGKRIIQAENADLQNLSVVWQFDVIFSR